MRQAVFDRLPPEEPEWPWALEGGDDLPHDMWRDWPGLAQLPRLRTLVDMVKNGRVAGDGAGGTMLPPADRTIVVLSGDFLAPSLLSGLKAHLKQSTQTRGWRMVRQPLLGDLQLKPSLSDLCTECAEAMQEVVQHQVVPRNIFV